MVKKEWTEEERKAFGEKMKAARAKNINKEESTDPGESTEIQPDQSVIDLQRQVKEMAENMARMQEAMQNANQGVQMNKQGDLVGEWEKYLIDPSLYPDPTPRLAKEKRLTPLAFDYNYELEYKVSTSSYETKTGKNVIEPRFDIQLNRIVLDEQGNQTDKRYIARKMIFHEDPQAALVIARENNLQVDKSDERLFLNEMRYYRVRDWLFNIFWPQPTDEQKQPIRDEVIGGTVVQVFTKSSEDPSGIEFDKLNRAL